jgi:hypothetical protein
VIGWFLLISVLFSAYLFACAALIAKINHTPMTKLFTQAVCRAAFRCLWPW